MLSHEDLKTLMETRASVYGSEGEKIGTLGQIYLDDWTDEPHFATVKTGHFGSSESFVPLSDAEISNGQLYVGYTKAFVKDAPNIDPMGHLGPEDEDLLYAYYSQAGLGAGQEDEEERVPPEEPHPAEPVGPVQNTPLGAEEHVHGFGGRSGHPRIRKYIVTERHAEATVSPETGDSAVRPRTDAASGDAGEPRVDGHRVVPEDPRETKPSHSGDPQEP